MDSQPAPRSPQVAPAATAPVNLQPVKGGLTPLEAAALQDQAASTAISAAAPQATAPQVAAQQTAVPQVALPVTMGSQAVPGWQTPGQPVPVPQIPQAANTAAPAQGEVMMTPPAASAPPQPTVTQPVPLQTAAAVPPPALGIQKDGYTELVREDGIKEIVLGPRKETKKTADKTDTPTLPKSSVTHCPHCTADLTLPVTPEPSDMIKQSFLFSTLGDKPFSKVHDMFGGQMQVTFRTLRVAEIDAVYDQVAREYKAGELTSALMQSEQVQRYRLFLQLTKLISKDGTVSHSLPESLDDWKVPDPDLPKLPQIRDQIIKDVLSVETIFRVIGTELGRFNRLVNKLEVMVFNSDFWKPTGEPS